MRPVSHVMTEPAERGRAETDRSQRGNGLLKLLMPKRITARRTAEGCKNPRRDICTGQSGRAGATGRTGRPAASKGRRETCPCHFWPCKNIAMFGPVRTLRKYTAIATAGGPVASFRLTGTSVLTCQLQLPLLCMPLRRLAPLSPKGCSKAGTEPIRLVRLRPARREGMVTASSEC